jgi:hypothetical protein
MIKYSTITTITPDFFDRCCGEQKFLCPECGVSLCVFCEDSCPGCGKGVDWTA